MNCRMKTPSSSVTLFFDSLNQTLKSLTALVVSLLYSNIVYLLCEPWFRILGRRTKARDLKLAQIARVLVVRLDEIGDVVLTVPFLRELRKNLPHANIVLLVSSATYNLVEHCPYVDEVLNNGPVAAGGIDVVKVPIKSLVIAARHLWKRRFDLAISPRWDEDIHQATFTQYFSGAPLRVGYSEKVNPRKSLHNKGRDRLLTHPLMESALKHEVAHNLDIVRFLDGKIDETTLELWGTEEDYGVAERILGEGGFNPSYPLTVLCPGAAAAKRMWPASRFAELGRCLAKRYGGHVLLIGGPRDTALGQELRAGLGHCAIDATGKTTLRQTYALLRKSDLYVGGDTGPMHIAAAARRPVVEISCHPRSGSRESVNSPERLGPWGTPHAVIQPARPIQPCSAECSAKSSHCITQITVAEVMQAAEKLLAGYEFRRSRLQDCACE